MFYVREKERDESKLCFLIKAGLADWRNSKKFRLWELYGESYRQFSGQVTAVNLQDSLEYISTGW